jgi:DNA polymerase-3 subunit beta
MKISISKEKFVEGLSLVQSVVSPRTTLPILSNVLLEASGDGLQLTTTDLEVGIQAGINANVEQEGATTLPAKKLMMIVKELPSGMVTLEVGADNVAVLKSGNGVYRIRGLSRDEFPPLPRFQDVAEFTLPQGGLAGGLKKTSYAMSTDETRYVLNGVYCQFAEGKLSLVATDGRRLAMMELSAPISPEEDLKIILPSKAVNELQKLLGDSGEVKVRISQNRASFELNNLLLITQLVDGNYPNFRQVIPTEMKERITLERETFLSTVKRVAILASDKSSIVKLSFSDGNLKVVADTPDIGEAEEDLPILYKGEAFSVAFNPEFLMAPLRNLPDDEVYLEVIDGMSPGVLKVKEPFLYVIMPMRIAR